jgi:Spy/CpxP family protein refolding chaperone
MNKGRATLLASLGFVFSLISTGFLPGLVAAGAEETTGGPFRHVRMRHWGVGGAPWIGIALRHRNDLNLTADQVSTLEELRADLRSQVAPLHKNLRDAESRIARLLWENPVDMALVKATIEEAQKLRSEFRYLRMEALDKGKSTLTTEQKDQLTGLISARRARFRQLHGETS